MKPDELSGQAVSDQFADVGKMTGRAAPPGRCNAIGSLAPEEDVKKVKRRLAAADRKSLKMPDPLDA